jgi:hypothetical protein
MARANHSQLHKGMNQAIDIQSASRSLFEQIKKRRWLVAIGVGKHERSPAIFIYCRSKPINDLNFLAGGWKGYTVVAKIVGSSKRRRVYRPVKRQPADLLAMVQNRE